MSGIRAAATVEWLDIVRQEYPLTEVTFVRDLGGNYNLNVQVSTDQGAFVVRVSPEFVDADRLAAVHAVRGYLGPSSRPELLALRGPQYEWALRLLRTPGWRTAFS